MPFGEAKIARVKQPARDATRASATRTSVLLSSQDLPNDAHGNRRAIGFAALAAVARVVLALADGARPGRIVRRRPDHHALHPDADLRPAQDP
eukprot:6179160-Pleurochrysis_carterae.AAC.1